MKLDLRDGATLKLDEQDLEASASRASGVSLVPVAVVARASTRLVAASGVLVAFTSSKPGVLRVVNRSSGVNVKLTLPEPRLDFTGLSVEAQNDDQFAIVACTAALIYKYTLPATFESNDEFEPISSTLNDGPDGRLAAFDSLKAVTVVTTADIAGSTAALWDCTKSPAKASKVHLNQGVSSAVIVDNHIPTCMLVSNSGDVYTWELESMAAASWGERKLKIALEPGLPVSTHCITSGSNSQVIAVVQNRSVQFVDYTRHIVYKLELPSSVVASACWKNTLFVADSAQRLVAVNYARKTVQAIKIGVDVRSMVVCDAVGQLRENHPDVFLYHESGVDILPLTCEELDGSLTPFSVKPKTNSRAPVPAGPAADNQSANLTESYDRSAIREKTYSLQDLLRSGQFVTKHAMDEMAAQHRADIRRLEQRIDGLVERLKRDTIKDRAEVEYTRAAESPRRSRPANGTAKKQPPRKPRAQKPKDEAERSPSNTPSSEADQTQPEQETSFPSEGSGKTEESSSTALQPEPLQEVQSVQEVKAAGPSVATSEAESVNVVEEPHDLFDQFKTAVYDAAQSAGDKDVFQSKLAELITRFDYSSGPLDGVEGDYNKQVIILVAISLISLAVSGVDDPTDYSMWLVALAGHIQPSLPEFHANPSLLESVLTQAQTNLKQCGSNLWINGAIMQLKMVQEEMTAS